MPLIVGNGRYVHEDIIAGTEVKMMWSLDHQMHHLRRQKQPGADVRLAVLSPHPNEAKSPFHYVNESWEQEPLPEVGSMEEAQYPEGHIKQMRPIEDFETAFPPYKGLGAHEHHHQDGKQSYSRGIGTSWYQAKQTGTICE